MDESVAALMRANLHLVFGERDAVRRTSAAESTYAEDVTFADEDGPITGREAVVERARALLDRVPPEFTFAEDGPIYGDGSRAALAWRFGPPGGAPVVRGLDIATIAAGRISALETLLLS
ncbi:nuclear transport factor 2 family protein [Nocardioides sp. BP30]|uniref:nuclear transport factor 2 family protein n=1 Tax=Nocardioides sp. BP30 TaxID=3036374 RepID=UPI002469ACA8|nr:nuclear transport factor 2 family protein [Nocardioides sp. BP30]WGL53550.1 nuclear transport factor 2 family protein [Nocardioides sp. BP30]